MTKTKYNKLMKEINKLENKYYLMPFNWTEKMLEISNKLKIKFEIGKTVESFAEGVDFYYTAHFEEISFNFGMTAGFGGGCKTVSIKEL